MRLYIKIVVSIAVLAFMVVILNYFTVHRDMRETIGSDPRNAGLVLYGYHDKLLIPGSIVVDLHDVSATNSAADVFRLLLQFSAKQKDKEYKKIFISFRGTPKFYLKGDYFTRLGNEYSTQNSVYTMRTFPENVFNVDGAPAYGTWTGGLLGVLGKQMEDFSDFHKRWYIADLASKQ